MRAVSYAEREANLALILGWKKTFDYSEGLKLYRSFLGETAMYWVLSLGATGYNRGKLLAAMEGLEAEWENQHFDANREEPDVVKDWRLETKHLMNERAALKAQIRVLKEVSERKAHAFKILDIGDLLDGLFGNIALFEEQGVVYEIPEKQVEQPLRKYLNLRSVISKTRTKLSQAILKEDEVKIQAKLTGLLLELKQLEETQEVKDYLK